MWAGIRRRKCVFFPEYNQDDDRRRGRFVRATARESVGRFRWSLGGAGELGDVSACRYFRNMLQTPDAETQPDSLHCVSDSRSDEEE